MHIVLTSSADHEATGSFYHSPIDDMQDAGLFVTWTKDVYPSPEFLLGFAERSELYLGLADGEIAAAMVLNHEATSGYKITSWPTTEKQRGHGHPRARRSPAPRETRPIRVREVAGVSAPITA